VYYQYSTKNGKCTGIISGTKKANEQKIICNARDDMPVSVLKTDA
jgi:hypothetical protein